MIVYKDIGLADFEPWSGAVSTYERIQNEGKLDQLEAILEEMYPDGVSETTINDILWFEEDSVFEWLGIRSESVIRSDILDAKEELDGLIEEYLAECADINDEYGFGNKTGDDMKQRLYDEDYKEAVKSIRERIKELEEELEGC